MSPPTIRLRDVTEADLPVLFDHQADPVANRMAAFPPRDREAFLAHWQANILGDDAVQKKAILLGEELAGYIACYERDGQWLVGYWIGREFWGRGVATGAVREFLARFPTRPLVAYVARSNLGSIRVLEKCGFCVSGEHVSPGPNEGETVEEWIFTLVS